MHREADRPPGDRRGGETGLKQLFDAALAWLSEKQQRATRGLLGKLQLNAHDGAGNEGFGKVLQAQQVAGQGPHGGLVAYQCNGLGFTSGEQGLNGADGHVRQQGFVGAQRPLIAYGHGQQLRCLHAAHQRAEEDELHLSHAWSQNGEVGSERQPALRGKRTLLVS